MKVVGKLFSSFAIVLAAWIAIPADVHAARTWFASNAPSGDTTRYRSPEEACYTGVIGNIIEGDRPGRPPTAEYRILSSAIDDVGGTGDYRCRGLLHVRTGPGATSWTLIIFTGDALVLGSPDSCNLPNYTDPVNGQCGPPKCTQGCNKAGGNGSNPIHTASGNKHQMEVDFIGAGGFPLRFNRSYNSNRVIERRAVPMGIGWTHSYAGYVVGASVSSGQSFNRAIVHRPDGRVLNFAKTDTTWTSDPDVVERLSLATDPSGMPIWTIVTANDEIETYDGIGLLRSITNRDGLTTTLSYIDDQGRNQGRVYSVTDAQGRSLIFGYDASRRLTTLSDGAGTTISYSYDASGSLANVTYPDPSGVKTRTYLYNENGQTGGISQPYALTGIVDETLNRFASWGYTSAGRANLSVHGAFAAGTIDRTAFAFNPNGTTTVTDALGQARTFGFTVQYLVAGLASINQPCDYCADAAQAKTYDANGYPDTETDFRGVVTDHDHNARGLETQRIEAKSAPGEPNPPEKRTIQTDWHPVFRVPTERRTLNAAGTLVLKANWTHNARGQVLTQTLTDPVTSETRTTANTYCEQPDIDAGTCPLIGLLRSVDGARTDVNDVLSYFYYQTDHPDCATSPTTCPYRTGDLKQMGNTIYAIKADRYDGAGRVLSTRDGNDVVTDYEYHPRGWLTATKVRGMNNATETDDRITRMEYWPTGLVKKVIQPDSDFVAYDYDIAHRLTRISDNDGNFIEYALDAMGNREAEETRDSKGVLLRKLTRDYNQLNRLLTQLDAYDRPTGFIYDADGHLDTVTDALTRVSDHDHDPLGRLERTLQDVGGIEAETTFGYNALDHLTRVTDPKGLNTNYIYNAFGDVLETGSPDTGTTTYTYDSAGNRKTQADARGITTSYTYDVLNRLKSVSYSDGSPSIGFGYDISNKLTCNPHLSAYGRLAAVTDESGSTRFCYDRFGDLRLKRQTTNGKVFDTRYTYTIGGRIATITYPDGMIVDYIRDAQGRPTEVGVTPAGGTRQVLLTETIYYPFGSAAEWFYGNGRRMQRSLDQNYQPGFIEDPFAGGLSLGYEFDEVGNLETLRVADQSDPPRRQFVYDGLNRLKESRDGVSNGLLWGYDYDKTGNRTSATIGSTTTSYTYPASSHRLGSVGSIGRGYDQAGNTTAIGGSAREFVYGGHNRMRQVKQGGAATMNYHYNGRGEQVRKFIGTTNIYSVYDEAGHWLGDYDNNGAPIQQAIWLDDLPVGVLVGSGINQRLHYIEPDALGTPRVVIDPARGAQGTVVWNWDLAGEAFGNIAPNQDPDGDATAFVFNMRYPGQRYDAASGLNYNYFRDYEPATGRYSQSDPIGLAGGVSTYAYVFGRPLRSSDPMGLSSQVLPWVPERPFRPGSGGVVLRICLAVPNPIVLGILLVAIPNSTSVCDTRDKPPECGGEDYQQCVQGCVRIANIENERCGIQFANDPRGYERCAAAVIANLELCVAQCGVKHGVE